MSTYILILFILLVFSFSLSGFETAISSLSKIELKNLILQPKYKNLQIWLENPSEYLTAILVGNSIVNILFATFFTIFFMTFIWGESSLKVNILCIILSTMFILIFGEITPKTFAKSHPIFLTKTLYNFINTLKVILKPILVVFYFIVSMFFKKNIFPDKSKITREDLRSLFSSAVDRGVIKYEVEKMIEAIFSLKNKKAIDIMVKFNDIEMLAATVDNEAFLDLIVEKEKSRIPVYKGDKKNIIGFIYIKDILQILYNPPENICQRFLRPVLFVNTNDTLYDVFEIFKKRKVHIVLVKEKDELVGLLTLEDILEEIIGDILDEYDVKCNLFTESKTQPKNIIEKNL